MIQKNTHIIYISHALIHFILHNSCCLHKLYNVNKSYNLHKLYYLYNSNYLHNTYNLYNSYDKVNISKYIKKLIKYFFKIFFLHIKMTNNYYQKTKKSFEKKHVKGTKIFLRKV